MTALGAIRLVFWREVTERLRSRSFQMTTAVIALATLLTSAWFSASRDDVRTSKLAVVGAMPVGLVDVAAQMSAETPRTRIDLSVVPTVAAGRELLQVGRLDAVASDEDHAVVYGSDDRSAGALLLQALRRADIVQRLVGAGAEETEARALVGSRGRATHIEVLRPATISVRGGVAALGVVASALFLFLYGMWIVQGVVQETSSGVSNIMVATCEPTRFIVGKTLGIGATALIQVVVTSLPSAVVLLLRSDEVAFSAWVLPSALMWFVLAFAIYGHLFAAVAGFGRKIERVSGTAIWVNAPLTLMACAGAISAFFTPKGSAATFLSFFPLSAPFAMPVRSIAADLPWWEVPLAASLAGLTAVVIARFSANLYLRGLAKQ